DTIFPVNTILAIKEPYVKLASEGGCNPLLRVDSPTDIVFLSSDDPVLKHVVWKWQGSFWKSPMEEIKSVDSWKAVGNKLFAQQEYLQAMVVYSKGIKQNAESSAAAVLFLNRSHTFFKLERFSSAFNDATEALTRIQRGDSEFPISFTMKAMYRQAASLYNLRRWSLAQAAFEKVSKMFPECVEASQGLVNAAARLKEASTGSFDFVKLFHASQKPSARLDVADFIGPVRVFSDLSKGGGRGLQTTRDVKAGEVLLVVKAVAIAYPEDLPKNAMTIEFNLLQNKMNSGTQIAMRSQLIYKLLDDPSLSTQAYSLYSGRKGEVHTDYPLEVNNSDVDPLQLPVPIDAGKLEGVATYNCFSDGSIDIAEFRPKNKDSSESDKLTALFLQSSLINHSCLYNATWRNFGDVQVIRALNDIPAGTEISVSYVVDGEYLEREKNLVHFFPPGEQCSCELCVMDRAEGKTCLKNRSLILDDLEALPRIGPKSTRAQIAKRLEQIDKLIDKIKGTYKSERPTSSRHEMYTLYQSKSFAYGNMAIENRLGYQECYANVIAAEKMGLECLGVKFQKQSKKTPNHKNPASLPISCAPQFRSHMGTCSMLQIAVAHKSRGEAKAARAWVQAAVWVHSLVAGGNGELFAACYGGMIKKLNLESEL
ncbi:hypothetical protein BDR26DRAFT_803228, partial [Obelidium mucronatum]